MPLPSAKSCNAPTWTTKKNTGVMSAGMKNSGSRNIPRIARWAIVTKSCHADARRASGT